MRTQKGNGSGAESVFDKYAWILLFSVGVMGVFGSYDFFFGVEPDPQYFQSITSLSWDSFIAERQGIVLYVQDALRVTGVLFLGLCLIIMAVSLTAFRKGESWAWFVLWFFPIMLGWITWLLYIRGGDTWPLHLTLAVMALLGLLLPIRKFFFANHPQD